MDDFITSYIAEFGPAENVAERARQAAFEMVQVTGQAKNAALHRPRLIPVDVKV